MRTATFFTRTKISKLARADDDPDEVARKALAVLDRFELDRPVRLLGVRVVLEMRVRPAGPLATLGSVGP